MLTLNGVSGVELPLVKERLRTAFVTPFTEFFGVIGFNRGIWELVLDAAEFGVFVLIFDHQNLQQTIGDWIGMCSSQTIV